MVITVQRKLCHPLGNFECCAMAGHYYICSILPAYKHKLFCLTYRNGRDGEDLETATLLTDNSGGDSAAAPQEHDKLAGGPGQRSTAAGADAHREKEGGMPELTLLQCLVSGFPSDSSEMACKQCKSLSM